jgi:hypothetical protein
MAGRGKGLRYYNTEKGFIMNISATIKYKKGYKYQLLEDAFLQTSILGYNIKTRFIRLTPDGMLTALAGYAWDGASGPTIDTKSSMMGSLFHDVIYQLMRENLISHEFRILADQYLHDICLKHGFFEVRADYWEFAVNAFGEAAINRDYRKEIEIAP